MKLDAHSFHLFNTSLEQYIEFEIVGTANSETVVHTFQVGGT